MKKIIAILLCLATLLPLASCSQELDAQATAPQAETKEEEKELSGQAKPQKPYPVVNDVLTREKINQFPIANDAMTLEEKRQLCIDFFRFTKTFAWTPSEDYKYVIESSGREVTLNRGKVYGSLPYVTIGSGNVYRILDYYDEATGVIDVKSAGVDPILFGNQCSIGAFWGWGRISNKAQYTWTQAMTQANGFLRVGPYIYDDSITDFSKGINTTDICIQNGKAIMYASYAELQPADGLVQYGSAGHVIMCSGVEVVYKADGTIDGEKSHIRYIDQTSSWKEDTQSNGDPFLRQGGLDGKMTFVQLYNRAYLPWTLPELLGIDPVEDSEVTFSFTEGNVISVDQLKASTITSNYAISDSYVIVLDKDGKQVDYKVVRARRAGVLTMKLEGAIFPSSMNKYANEDYSIRVEVQISNGERLTLFEGSLTK